MEAYEDDGPWIWVAFAPDSRLIVAFIVGPRKQYVANELVKLTDDCLSENKPVFVTDGLDFYKVALLNHYGLQIEYPIKVERIIFCFVSTDRQFVLD